MIEIIPFTDRYLDAATKLFIKKYENMRLLNSCLPSKYLNQAEIKK